jgi:leucyl aminopeptidase
MIIVIKTFLQTAKILMMTKFHFKFESIPHLDDRKTKDAIVLPFWHEKGKPVVAFKDSKKLKKYYEIDSVLEDFKGKKGDAFVLYPNETVEKRIILLGLGEIKDVSTYIIREVYHQLVSVCKKKNVSSLNLIFPDIADIEEKDLLTAICETIVLSNYEFIDLKFDSIKDKKAKDLSSACIIGTNKNLDDLFENILLLCKGVYLSRNLINRNADDITPLKLAEIALSLEEMSSKIKTIVFDKKRIEKEKMNLLLAVSRGSDVDPRFIIVSYQGNPDSKDHIALVGKGVTYDTGGLSLKPTNSMLEMKSDMGGAATVLGTIYALALLNIKINVKVVIASCENSIGSKSYKLGDVYQGYSGSTVEITNTDAEGRLVLADALAYTEKNLNPKAIINLATLTGGVVVALGDEIAGYFSNNEVFSKKLETSAKETDELLWKLPLHLAYNDMLKSNVADIKNSAGREASSIQGALFLHHFVKKTPWIHIDIAGVAFWDKSKCYSPMFATGYGVRMLVNLLKNDQLI